MDIISGCSIWRLSCASRSVALCHTSAILAPGEHQFSAAEQSCAYVGKLLIIATLVSWLISSFSLHLTPSTDKTEIWTPQWLLASLISLGDNKLCCKEFHKQPKRGCKEEMWCNIVLLSTMDICRWNYSTDMRSKIEDHDHSGWVQWLYFSMIIPLWPPPPPNSPCNVIPK